MKHHRYRVSKISCLMHVWYIWTPVALTHLFVQERVWGTKEQENNSWDGTTVKAHDKRCSNVI